MPRLAAFPKGFFDALVAGRMSVFQWIDLAAELELFLAPSRSGGSGGIQEWIVYSPTAEGKYRLLDIISFSCLGFRVSQDPVRFHAFYKSGDWLVTFAVDATGFHQESKQEGADPESGSSRRGARKST